MDKKFFTIKELANKFSCVEKTIRRMMQRGELSYYKIGGQIRFSNQDIDKYLAERHHVAGKDNQ